MLELHKTFDTSYYDYKEFFNYGCAKCQSMDFIYEEGKETIIYCEKCLSKYSLSVWGVIPLEKADRNIFNGSNIWYVISCNEYKNKKRKKNGD